MSTMTMPNIRSVWLPTGSLCFTIKTRCSIYDRGQAKKRKQGASHELTRPSFFVSSACPSHLFFAHLPVPGSPVSTAVHVFVSAPPGEGFDLWLVRHEIDFLPLALSI